MQIIAQSKTISEAYVKRAKANPKKVAFRFKKGGEWNDVTFAEHSETTKRLACGLLHSGIKKGDRVCVVANTSIFWSQFDLAILSAGGITVPVYPTNTPEDTAYIINHCEASLLFVDDFKNLQKIAEVAKDCPKLKKVVVNFELRSGDVDAPFEIVSWNSLHDIGLNQEPALGARVDANLADAKPEDVFTICYTSGTTGQPKGVVLTHSAMSSVMVDVEFALRGITGPDEILLSFLPMSHIFGKWESMVPYFLGWTSTYAESIDSLVANLSEVRPTLWVAVPRIFEKVYAKIMTQVQDSPPARQKIFHWALGVGREMLDARTAGKRPGLPLLLQHKAAKKLVFSKISARFGGRLSLCVSGSAPLARNIQEFMHIVGVPVYEGYGLTETCAPVSVNTPTACKFGSVGKLLPEVLAKIADDGEILIKSAKNFKEYYRNPEATKEALKDGWFYTGDIGHIDDEGYLFITDRKKDLIKTAGGKYIAPQKIENAAKTFPLLSQVVLYGDQKPFAVALITLNQEYLIQHAQANKILYSDYSELVKSEAVQKLVAECIEKLNSGLARFETVKKYVLLPKEFTVEDGDLTPSLKVKRKQVCKKFQAQLEALYNE
ncbi:MAG TPA: long-chain fatty acid--CoA ligase [Bdellovibrionota bacterium]|jgi:long-chain acyl-CoA synthetase